MKVVVLKGATGHKFCSTGSGQHVVCAKAGDWDLSIQKKI